MFMLVVGKHGKRRTNIMMKNGCPRNVSSEKEEEEEKEKEERPVYQ